MLLLLNKGSTLFRSTINVFAVSRHSYKHGRPLSTSRKIHVIQQQQQRGFIIGLVCAKSLCVGGTLGVLVLGSCKVVRFVWGHVDGSMMPGKDNKLRSSVRSTTCAIYVIPQDQKKRNFRRLVRGRAGTLRESIRCSCLL